MSRPPLRIAVFIHSLHAGGAERVAAELSSHWARAGHEVCLITQSEGRDVYLLHSGVVRRSLGTAGASGGGWRGVAANLRRLYALRRALREFKPDVVLGMMTTSSVLAVLAARGLPCRVIATEHTHPPSQSLSRLWLALRRFAYPKAARVVALTQGTADWLADHVPCSRLDVIPNPVQWPLATSEPMRLPPNEVGKHYVLAVGRLHPDKGFDVLIEAYAQIARDYPDWDLIVLGEGPLREALTRQIEAADLAGRVHLPGRAGNVAQWYAGAHIYVLSSRVEGLSNTLLEAMASGLPPVAFDCDTGPREIVRDGHDGRLVRPAGDAGALAVALREAIDQPALREQWGQAAVSVRERFSPAAVLARWDRVFAQTQDENRQGEH